MTDFKGSQFEQDIILWGVRCNEAYSSGYLQLQEMRLERSVEFDHLCLNRWGLERKPVLYQVFRQRNRPEGERWRMNGTKVSLKGLWKYLY